MSDDMTNKQEGNSILSNDEQKELLKATITMYENTKAETRKKRKEMTDKNGGKIYSDKSTQETIKLLETMENDVIEQFIKDENNAPEPDTLSYLIRLGADIREVKVEMDERTEGQSYLTPVNASKYMIHMMMSICVFQWFRDRKVVL